MAAPPRPLPKGIPPELHRLIQLFSKISGVGEKTAQRYALGMVVDLRLADELGDALLSLRSSAGVCRLCNYLSRPDELCSICDDHKRDPRKLCVVHSFRDVIAFEQSGAWRGRYFVIGKLMSPLEGVGRDELPVEKLINHVHGMMNDTGAGPERTQQVEVVLALPPSVDGDATTLLLDLEFKQTLAGDERWLLTRLGRGVGHNADLTYADALTLGHAIEGRKRV